MLQRQNVNLHRNHMYYGSKVTSIVSITLSIAVYYIEVDTIKRLS